MRNRLVILRESANLKSVDVCEKVGLEISLYSKWENNKVEIPMKHLLTLVNFYKTSVDYVLGLSNNKLYKVETTKINLKEIGIRLKQIRKELRLTQQQLADKIDSSADKIYNYEVGRSYINCDSLIKLCKLTNVSADWIVGRSDDKYLK